jgi:L-asparaginase / beta-aspartyl-peptidase
MKSFALFTLLGVAVSAPQQALAAAQPIAIVIHGGAGVIDRASLTPMREAAIRADLERAVKAGYAALSQGRESIDAVSTAIQILEDSPYFNAGKGAVFNSDGVNELDAAIMDGHRRKAGAVSGLRHVRNPIALARLVMERSNHVMLTGTGAEKFAKSMGVRLVDASYFRVQERWEQLKAAQRLERVQKISGLSESADQLRQAKLLPARAYFGTVGAAALDQNGHLAAGTSTGGMTNKRFGRVGDTPIIGAGTYANEHCAISATGYGEFFIRSVVAYDICAKQKYLGWPLARAANGVILEELKTIGGEGGVIALDQHGNISTPFNSKGMYRASIDSSGKLRVDIF